MTTVGNAEYVENIASRMLHLPSEPKIKSKSKFKLKPKQIQNNKRLGSIITRILEYHGKTREAVAEYCKVAIEEGFTGIEAWEYLCIKLKDKVAKSTLYDWGNKYLPEGSMKVTKPNVSTIKIPVSESSKSERSLPQKQLQAQIEGRMGKTNQPPDEYDINRLEDYDVEYLRDVIIWLHETKAELIQGGFKWQTKFDDMKREKTALQSEIKALREENTKLKHLKELLNQDPQFKKLFYELNDPKYLKHYKE